MKNLWKRESPRRPFPSSKSRIDKDNGNRSKRIKAESTVRVLHSCPSLFWAVNSENLGRLGGSGD